MYCSTTIGLSLNSLSSCLLSILVTLIFFSSPRPTIAQQAPPEPLQELAWMEGRWSFSVVAASKFPNVRKTGSDGQHLFQPTPLHVEWIGDGQKLRIRLQGIIHGNAPPLRRQQFGRNVIVDNPFRFRGREADKFRALETMEVDQDTKQLKLTLQKDPYRKVIFRLSHTEPKSWFFVNDDGVELEITKINADAFLTSFVDPYNSRSKYFLWCKREEAEN